MDSKEKINPIIANHQPQCLNCGYLPLLPETKFCPSCGQNCKEKRITVWSLIREAFANLFNLDNKLWQTLVSLFIPGKLTKEFFLGRRQRYVSPLRIFLITAIGFFAVIQMFTADDTDKLISSLSENQKKNAFYAVFLEQLALESDTLLQDSVQYSSSAFALDSLQQRMHQSYSDSTMIGLTNIISQQDTFEELIIARKDLVQLSQDSLVKQYGNGNYWDDLLLRQNLRLAGKGENFLSYLMGQLVWMMLIMMPFLAVFLKLIYIRRDFYYVDHLIFSFHTHAFVFLAISILLITNHYLPVDSTKFALINTIGGIGVFIYLYTALLKVYDQSKTKTFVKLLIMNFFYLALFFTAIALTSIISVLFY